MSQLDIRDLHVTADASLDGTEIKGRWIGDEFAVFFVRDGDVVAGFNLGEKALNALYVLLGVALKIGEEQ